MKHPHTSPGVRAKFAAHGWDDIGNSVTFPLGRRGFPECHLADDKQGCALILTEGTFLRVPWEALDQARDEA
jgi:hypothetical protein